MFTTSLNPRRHCINRQEIRCYPIVLSRDLIPGYPLKITFTKTDFETAQLNINIDVWKVDILKF